MLSCKLRRRAEVLDESYCELKMLFLFCLCEAKSALAGAEGDRERPKAAVLFLRQEDRCVECCIRVLFSAEAVLSLPGM